ncbi:MAG: hypothetical protein PHR50_15015 [Lachnospiraceae bacterium]|nr:hypothetical protein [Lachnospiraceae bacterium]
MIRKIELNLATLREYLNNKITFNWYKNTEIDYGITGKFIDIETMGNHLIIIHEEMGERLETNISYYNDYSMEQIYNIWMEG